MKKYLFGLTLLILIIGCRKEKPFHSGVYDEIENITIDVKKGEVFLYDSLFSENVSFVKLETRDDNLIGEVSNIFFDDSLIFVADIHRTKSIFIFDMKGRYLSKIARYGNGPGEYSLMYKVFLVKEKKEIVVVDTPQHKNIHYSYSGEFLYEERRPFPMYSCEYLESGKRAYYIAELDNPQFDNPHDNVIVVTDSNNNIIYSACNEFLSDDFRVMPEKNFWKYGEELYFYPNYSDTIFLITDTAAIAKYYIDIIPNKMPKPYEIDNLTVDSYFKDYLNKYSHFRGVFIELEDFTYLELSHFDPKIVYSHKEKKVKMYGSNINTLYHFFDRPVARYGDNTVVVPTSPYRLLQSEKFMREDAAKIRERFGGIFIEVDKEILDSLYYDMNEEDNPVLFFYELQ